MTWCDDASDTCTCIVVMGSLWCARCDAVWCSVMQCDAVWWSVSQEGSTAPRCDAMRCERRSVTVLWLCWAEDQVLAEEVEVEEGMRRGWGGDEGMRCRGRGRCSGRSAAGNSRPLTPRLVALIYWRRRLYLRRCLYWGRWLLCLAMVDGGWWVLVLEFSST